MQRHAIPLTVGQKGQRSGQVARVVELAETLLAVGHGRRGVDDQPDDDIPLDLGLPNEKTARPGEELPIEPPGIVTRLIATVLLELCARSRPSIPVLAGEESLDNDRGHQPQVVDRMQRRRRQEPTGRYRHPGLPSENQHQCRNGCHVEVRPVARAAVESRSSRLQRSDPASLVPPDPGS